MVTQSQKTKSFQPSSLGTDDSIQRSEKQGTPPPPRCPARRPGLGVLSGAAPQNTGAVTWPQACSFTPVLPSPPGPGHCPGGHPWPSVASPQHAIRGGVGSARECEPTSQDTRTLEKYGHLRDSNRAQTTYSPGRRNAERSENINGQDAAIKQNQQVTFKRRQDKMIEKVVTVEVTDTTLQMGAETKLRSWKISVRRCTREKKGNTHKLERRQLWRGKC